MVFNSKIRDAKPSDVPLIKEVFEKVLPQSYPDDFFTELQEGIASGILPAFKELKITGKLVAKVVLVQGTRPGEAHLAGAAIIHTMNLKEARENKREDGSTLLDFDILDKQTDKTMGAYVMMIGIMPKYRRNYLGRGLMSECMQSVLQDDPSMQVVYLHMPETDDISPAFFEELSFSPFGRIPNYYKPVLEDGEVEKEGDESGQAAIVWVAPFHNGELVQYQLKKGEELPNLSDVELKRVKKTPKWIVDLMWQFGFPLLIVVILFLISYGLVVAGPLRGIAARKVIKSVALEDVDPDDDFYDDVGVGSAEL